MAHITADRVRQTSTSIGTGSIVLSGSLAGFRDFSAVLAVNDTFWYSIASYPGSEWEVGLGTYTSASTFTRTTVLSSSNAGSAVTFSAGTKEVFITAAASKFLQADASGNYGIGTSSPTTKLEVALAAGTATQTRQFMQASGAGAAAAFMRLTNTGADGVFGIADSGGSAIVSGGVAYATQLYTVGATALQFGTNSAIKATLDASGNLGIGTVSPGYKLDISVATNTIAQQWQGSGTNFTLRLKSGDGSVASSSVYRLYMDWNNSLTNGFIDFYRGTAGNDGFLTFGTSGSERLRIDSTGNVVIGATSTTYKLQVVGSFAATTKSFVIDHPTKEGKKLRYGSLEGPENGVYVRGKLSNNDTIELPEYWTKLVDEDSITVNLTPIGKHQKLYVKSIKDNKVIIGNENLLGSINCFYTIFAERIDVSKLEVEID